MADHLENTLRAAIKSLRDVVSPAVDTDDPMAQEQMAISLMALEFVQSRMSLLHARDRFWLHHHIQMGHDVADAMSSEPPRLRKALADARSIVDSPAAPDTAVCTATEELAAAISAVVDEDLDEPTRRAVERAVLEASEQRVEFERAWHAPMGFDPQVESIASLDTAVSAYESADR